VSPEGTEQELPPPPAGYKVIDEGPAPAAAGTAPQLPPPPAGYKVIDEGGAGNMLDPIGYRDGMPVYRVDVYNEPVFKGRDESGRPILGLPPAPAAPPIPRGLTQEGAAEDAQEPARLNPRTGQPMKDMPMGSIPFVDAPYTGLMDASYGWDRLTGSKAPRFSPEWRHDVAGGSSQVIRGGLEALMPLLPGALIEAPLTTALTLAAGSGMSGASEATLNAMGVPTEYSALAGDLVGLWGAGWAHSRLQTLAKVPLMREANELKARLEEATTRAKDPNATDGERAAAKAQVDSLLDRVDRAQAAYRAPGSLESAAANEARRQGQKYGVRMSAGDVSQIPTLKNIEVSAEKVPGMGMEPFRAGQQIEAKQAATGLKSQYENALIEAEPSSLAELQDAAEGGDQRARNVLEKMNTAGNDPDRVIQASIGLGDWTTRQTATALYDKVQKLAEDHNLGDVPMKATGKAIGSSLEELRPAKLPNKEVIGLLAKIKESISPKLDEEGNPLLDVQGNPVSPNNTYGLIRQLHSDLGERIREYYQGNNALIGEKGVGHLERVQNALENDMRTYAKNSGVPEIVEAGQAADEYYKSARVPYKNGMLAAAATSTEPDQVFQQFIKAGKGDRARNFYSALDDRGQAAVRYNMIAKAVDDSINPQSGIFSPQKFFTAVDKLDQAYGVFFNGKDKAEVQGFKNLMGHVTRAGQFAENPPTGQRVIPYLVAGGAGAAAAGAAAHPFLAGAGLALIGAARGLFTTVKGRDLLLRLNGIKQDSPLMDSVWQQIAKEMPKGPPEPPTAPTAGGGPPKPSPAGSGGGVAPASMGNGSEQALAYAREQIAAGHEVKAPDLQRRFQLGYGAAQKVLETAGGQPGKSQGGSPGEPPNPKQPVPAVSTTERAPGVAREVGPHGPVYDEFYHDAQAALEHFKNHPQGDAIGALHHPAVGDFDLTANIAAKLRNQHPEVVDDLQGFVSGLHKISETPNRIRLGSGDRRQIAVIRLDYDGAAKRWLVTAFEKKSPPATGRSTDISGTP
jgi:hypothetical protein